MARRHSRRAASMPSPAEYAAAAPSSSDAPSALSSASTASTPWASVASAAASRRRWRSAGKPSPAIPCTRAAGGRMRTRPGGASREPVLVAATAACSATAAPRASPPKKARDSEALAARRRSLARELQAYCAGPASGSWAPAERPWPRKSKRSTVRPRTWGLSTAPTPRASSAAQEPPRPWTQARPGEGPTTCTPCRSAALVSAQGMEAAERLARSRRMPCQDLWMC
mmetsp:Transcript_25490/g.73184  ORF Transcript_25490/g.73184 Transcript_25490/m.73184 type:complete len:227 (+) Transcript_25490:582-1262(+)